MDGQIKRGDMFVDDTIGGKGSHYQFPAADIEYMINSATDLLKPGARGRRRLPPMDQWLFSALDEHSIQGGQVAVFGSMSPWYEAIAVAAGAAEVTTIEYNHLTYTHPQMKTTTPTDLVLPVGGFDAALSISSFDHDGPSYALFFQFTVCAWGGGGGGSPPSPFIKVLPSTFPPPPPPPKRTV
jgi:hypothetical protein